MHGPFSAPLILAGRGWVGLLAVVMLLACVVPVGAQDPVRPAKKVQTLKEQTRREPAHPRKRRAEAGKPAEAHGKGGKTDAKGHTPPPQAPAAAVAVPTVRKPAKETEPGLPLPRFASLKTDETNMRRGPGQRYPIDWVYHRRDLPVQVEREYDIWRYVRDPDGVQGWVHEVTLSEQRRTFVVKDHDATLRDSADDKAAPVAVLKIGVIGRFRACEAGLAWCQVQAGGFKGYVRRDQVWGLLPGDVVAP